MRLESSFCGRQGYVRTVVLPNELLTISRGLPPIVNEHTLSGTWRIRLAPVSGHYRGLLLPLWESSAAVPPQCAYPERIAGRRRFQFG